MRSPRTIKQIRNEIKDSYRSIEIDLKKDLSDAGNFLRDAFNSWFEQPQPEWDYLKILRDYALQYQSQLSGDIRLHIVVDYLILKINSVLSDNLIGFTDIFDGFPNNNCVVRSPSEAFSAINKEVSSLNGEDLNFHNIALSITKGSCAEYNDELIRALEIDLQAWGNNPAVFQSSIISLGGQTSASIVNNIYSLLDSSAAGQIDALVNLAEAIKLYKLINYETEYTVLVSNMNNIMQGLTSSLYQQVAFNVANMVGASEDVVNGLELFLSHQYPVSYLANSPIIKQVQGDDPYEIAASFYMNGYPNYPFVKSMGDAMASFKNNNPTSDIVEVIHNAINSLSSSVISNQIAQQMLSSLNSSNQDLYAKFTLSLDNIMSQKNIFASDIIVKLQDSFGQNKDSSNSYDDPYLIAQALDNILAYNNSVNVVNEAELLFASYIDLYHLNNEIDYSLISSSLYNELNRQYINNQNDFNLMAKSIAAVFDQDDNNYFVELLEYQMMNIYESSVNSSSIFYPYVQASNIMQQMDTRSDMLYDGASVAALYYSQIEAFADQNKINSRGAELLIEAVENAVSNAKIHDSITTLYGDVYINPFGAATYFNKCDNNEGVYTVTESVFNWDGGSITGELRNFRGINSITGIISVFAKCGSWILTIENQDLLVTTTKPIGTTGNMEDTGCSLPLDPGMAMGICESLFDATPR